MMHDRLFCPNGQITYTFGGITYSIKRFEIIYSIYSITQLVYAQKKIRDATSMTQKNNRDAILRELLPRDAII